MEEKLITTDVPATTKTSLAPNTTEQEDLVAHGQREINLIWETTQSHIARMAVYTGIGINVLVPIILLFIEGEIPTAKVAVIAACLGAVNTTVGIIIGFYFSRTNHTAIGGVGKKPIPSTEGIR